MLRLFRRSSVPREALERLRMATAVAAERVLDEHVRSALELVDEAADRSPLERLLRAYSRLHHLSDGDARKLRDRVLASLGRDDSSGDRVAVLDEPRSPFRRLRNRLRGRVHLDLRDWVERQTARVELTILDLHVEQALGFVRILEEYGDIPGALDAYADMMSLRSTIGEMVRLRVLKTLHDELRGDVEPLHPRPTPLPLRRVVDNGS